MATAKENIGKVIDLIDEANDLLEVTSVDLRPVEWGGAAAVGDFLESASQILQGILTSVDSENGLDVAEAQEGTRQHQSMKALFGKLFDDEVDESV